MPSPIGSPVRVPCDALILLDIACALADGRAVHAGERRRIIGRYAPPRRTALLVWKRGADSPEGPETTFGSVSRPRPRRRRCPPPARRFVTFGGLCARRSARPPRGVNRRPRRASARQVPVDRLLYYARLPRMSVRRLVRTTPRRDALRHLPRRAAPVDWCHHDRLTDRGPVHGGASQSRDRLEPARSHLALLGAFDPRIADC